MGLMDKAKEAALKAKAEAQQLAQQGQAKVAEIKETREEAELYKNLGQAYYAEQRKGGGHDAVEAALAALDAHVAAAAAADSAASSAAPPPSAPAAPPPSAPAAPPPSAPAAPPPSAPAPPPPAGP
jgi:hypothetical protein